jgi:hypothetical protein
MMPRGAGFSLAVAWGLAAATAGAQNVPGNPSRPGMPVKTAEIIVSDEVKAIGCLARDDRGRFLLNDAAVEVTPYLSPNATRANGPTGGDKTSKPFSSKTSFTLKFDGLDQHVGHTIEVTGKLDPATANLEPTPDTVAGRGRTVTQGADTPKLVPRLDRPHMNVVSMKMISTSCAQTR